MLKILLVTLTGLLCVAAQTQTPTDVAVMPLSAMIENLSMLAVKWITSLYNYALEFMEIEIRSFRVLASLYTEDNLIYLRRLMSVVLRFFTWVNDMVPQTTSEGYSRVLNYLFPTASVARNANVFDPLYDALHLRRPSSYLEGRLGQANENGVMNLDKLLRAGTEKSSITTTPTTEKTTVTVTTRNRRKSLAKMDDINLQTPLNS